MKLGLLILGISLVGGCISQCHCGQWSDADSNTTPDITVNGMNVALMGTITLSTADFPLSMESGFQCQGNCYLLTYDWQIIGPGGFNNSTTQVPAPIILTMGDLDGPGEYVMNLEAHCEGEECLADFKYRLIVEGTPSISAEKMVSTDGGVIWEDTVEQNVCENVQFQITVINDGDVPLTNITITDHLPECLAYVGGPAVNGICLTSGSPYYNLPGTTTPTWTCPEHSPGDTVQVTYTAHVVQSGICKNQVVVEGEYNGQIVTDFSGAVVNGIVLCNPALTFEKKVWDEDTQQWVDSIHAPLNTVVTFSITITNT